MIPTKEKSVTTKDSRRMCVAAGVGYAASKQQLPITTPATAFVEQLGGGRSVKENLMETTGAGKTFFPKKPKYRANKVKKRKTSSIHSQRTGSGLRINNKNLYTGLQLK